MCISCHDGSVRDSRKKICNDPGHRVGRVATEGISIPPEFPLDENGGLKCTTCHTPHVVNSGSGSLVQYFLRAPNENSSFCRQCHVGNLGGPEKGNHPLDVTVDRQAAGYIRRSGGKFAAGTDNRIVCETCHQAHGGVNDQRLVLPEENTATMSNLCEVCHPRTGGRPDSAVAGGVSHPIDVRPAAGTPVPKTWANGKPLFLSTAGQVVCRTCHQPHGNAGRRFLLADNNRSDSICRRCHADKAAIVGSAHDLALSAPGLKIADGATVSDSGPCSACHRVHDGTAAYMWGGPSLPVDAAAKDYCLVCHRDGACGEKKQPAGISHPLSVPVPSGAGELPLFDAAGGRAARGTIACMSCHNLHDPAPLASGPAEPIRRGRFLRLGEGGPEAHCLQCHTAQSAVLESAHDLRGTASGYRNQLGQAPAEAGTCAACHVAHNAPHEQYLWAAPPASGSPPGWIDFADHAVAGVASLCTGCHQQGGAAESPMQKFGRHPDDFYRYAVVHHLSFEPSGVNLYDADGKRSDSGAITCATCHEPHANTSGAGLGSFLRTGLSRNFCTTCHGPEALLRFMKFHAERKVKK